MDEIKNKKMKHIHTFESFVNEAARADMGPKSRTVYRRLKHKVYTLAELESLVKSKGVELPKELYDNIKQVIDKKGISIDRLVFSTETDHASNGFHSLPSITWYGELRDKKTGETYRFWDIKESEELLDESIVNEAQDLVTFTIDDDKLDRLLHDFHKRELDYVDVKGDQYYTLPRREFDRFMDAADSKGFDVDYEDSEDSVVYVMESSMTKLSEGVLVEPSRYVRAHGKKPSGMGKWAFEIGGEEVFTPTAMNYTDAQNWAKEEAKKKNVNVVYTLG